MNPHIRVETPVFNKDESKEDDPPPHNKGGQYPSPDPKKANIPLAKQLEKDARKAEKKRRRKEKKRKRREREREPRERKRRKIIQQYPEFSVPSFPKGHHIPKVHAAFAKTPEAQRAREEPRTAFRKLTSMLVAATKRECNKTYMPNGPFGHLSEILSSSLDWFEKTLTERAEASTILFKRGTGEPSVRELEATNSIACVSARRKDIQERIESMKKLVTSLRDGSSRRNLEARLGDLPKPVLAEGESKEEAEANGKALREEHSTCSKSIDERVDEFAKLSIEAQESREERERRAKVEAQRRLFKSKIQGTACGMTRPLGDILASFGRWQALVQ